MLSSYALLSSNVSHRILGRSDCSAELCMAIAKSEVKEKAQISVFIASLPQDTRKALVFSCVIVEVPGIKIGAGA